MCGGELLLRDVDHDALAQLDGVQVVEIAVEGDFVVRAAIGVVEDGARHAAARELAQIGDAVDDWHGSQFLAEDSPLRRRYAE